MPDKREGAFVVARHGEVIGIAPLEPTELRAALLRSATFLKRTHSVTLRAGVSTQCPSLAELGRGYVEARRALAMLRVGSGRRRGSRLMFSPGVAAAGGMLLLLLYSRRSAGFGGEGAPV